jgi:uncharacterized protein
LKIENQYIIHFKGLKEGVHDFAFTIDRPFFESYEQLEIPDGSVAVSIELIKKVNLIELFVDLSGNILVPCDRCLGLFYLPLACKGHLVVSFTETGKEPDEEVLYLHPEDHQLNLKHYLYECIRLGIPLRKVHRDLPGGETGCDSEMLKKLSEHLIQE